MLPTAIAHMGNNIFTFLWVLIGFSLFLVLEQFLHWHHCHKAPSEHSKEPLTYLILVADGIHNFIGGSGVAASFMLDIRVGMMAWLAAALHEIPQELGDYGVLIHGGWSRRQALTFNFLSSLSFPVAGVVTFYMASAVDVSFLVPFAAGNFIYIAAADLVPEIKKKDKLRDALINFVFFLFGIGLLLAAHVIFEN
jgi:zinc and cadmium transporter